MGRFFSIIIQLSLSAAVISILFCTATICPAQDVPKENTAPAPGASSVSPAGSASEKQVSDPVGDPGVPRLTLRDCVNLALMNNIDIKGAYLDRLIDRLNLQQAEKRYWLPTDPTLTLSAATDSTYIGPGREQDFNPGGAFVSTLALPTGGSITVTWDNSAYREDIGVAYAYTSGWSASFTQPLLKGGGIDNAAFAVRSARIQEEINMISLRSTIESRITQAISHFRAYASAIRTLENRKKSLDNARQTLEINKSLVEAGRMARTELVQSEADIANKEFDVVSARNDLDAKRLALASFLNIDKNIAFHPVDESEVKVEPPTLKEAVEIALRNRTDYRKALYNQEIKRLTLKKAARNKMWQLDLQASTFEGKTGDGETFADAFGNQSITKRNWSLGLSLTIPLTALTDDKIAYLSARNEVEKGEWTLKKMRQDIEIDVQNAIRNVEMQYRSLELARLARQLAEQKLQIETEKLKVGRTTNFQLVSFQNDLKSRQDAERDAINNYLNSLHQLDVQLGVALERWNIVVTKEDDSIGMPQTDLETSARKISEIGGAERKGP